MGLHPRLVEAPADDNPGAAGLGKAVNPRVDEPVLTGLDGVVDTEEPLRYVPATDGGRFDPVPTQRAVEDFRAVEVAVVDDGVAADAEGVLDGPELMAVVVGLPMLHGACGAQRPLLRNGDGHVLVFFQGRPSESRFRGATDAAVKLVFVHGAVTPGVLGLVKRRRLTMENASYGRSMMSNTAAAT